MLRHKRNIRAKQTHSEHVSQPRIVDALHPHGKIQIQIQKEEAAKDTRVLERLQYNQHLNERVTLCLELYHKNIIKKQRQRHDLNKFNVYKLSKNVCQT